MPITLNYWNGRGLMEVPRMVFACAGKSAPADFVDGRHSTATGGITSNLGRMPCLDDGGQSVGQSGAVNFYVASECGMMGSNHMEAAQILAIQEHIKEMGGVYNGLCPYGSVPTAEALNKWYDEGATDNTGAAVREGYSTRFLTWWMGRIEETLGGDGFAVGGKLSLADVLLYDKFMGHLKAEECPPDFAEYRKSPFADKARLDAKLAKYPKLLACCNSVANNAGVIRHLANRGVQGF